MNENIEQRVCIKFCIANEISCCDAFVMLKNCYGENALSKTRSYEWYKAIKEGRTTLEDLPRSGRPVRDKKIEEMKKIALQNCNINLRVIQKNLNITREIARLIINRDLFMKIVASRLVPKELNVLQKQHREEFAMEMLERNYSDPTFMERIITGGELLICENAPKASKFTDEENEPEPKLKKSRQDCVTKEVVLIVFFDIRGIIHAEFLPNEQMISKEYYLSAVRRLRKSVHKRRPDLYENNSWILHHSNEQPHNSLLVTNYLTARSVQVINQSPHSPDMTPCDFFLYPKLSRSRKHFDSIEAMKKHIEKKVNAIPQTAYDECYKDWKKRLNSCFVSNGEYCNHTEVHDNEN